MDLLRFKELMAKPPGQGAWEWQFFLEFVDVYFKNRRIKDPIVVEIGTRRNRQKTFYTELLGARHIGIDISGGFSMPDVLGDSKDPKTLEALKIMLGEKPINLLFIDGSHKYEDVRSDYEVYGPLVKDIIAFHDISSTRLEVHKLWDALVDYDAERTAKSSIRIGYGTGLIMLTEGEKIYDRFKNYDKYF